MSLELTLCDDPSGDPRVARPDEIAAIGQAVPSALLLLIHGHHNDVDDASTAYDAFERLQRQMSGQPDYAPGTTVARVFWPAGSHVWQFMAAIRRAPAVGAVLAESLVGIARLQQRPPHMLPAGGRTRASLFICCTGFAVLGLVAALSMMLFIRSMNRSLVRHRYSGEALPSRRIDAATDEARLQTLRPRVTVLELEGALFFGSASRVAELADGLDGSCYTLVLDFRRVILIDSSGGVVQQQLHRRLAERGVALLLAGVAADNRHGRVLAQFVGECLFRQGDPGDRLYAISSRSIDVLSGEAVAVGDTEVHALDQSTLLRLRDEDPLLYAQVFRNVVLHLSQRLRAAAWAWRASTN